MDSLILECVSINSDYVRFNIKDFVSQKGALVFNSKYLIGTSLNMDTTLNIEPNINILALIIGTQGVRLDVTQNDDIEWNGLKINIKNRVLTFKKDSSIIFGLPLIEFDYNYPKISYDLFTKWGDL